MIFLLRIELTNFVVVPITVGNEFNSTCTLFFIDKDYIVRNQLKEKLTILLF
jgi:hypothetical protein